MASGVMFRIMRVKTAAKLLPPPSLDLAAIVMTPGADTTIRVLHDVRASEVARVIGTDS